jgi:cyclophilin family peptidyl-prolyl cis-trans isomerase
MAQVGTCVASVSMLGRFGQSCTLPLVLSPVTIAHVQVARVVSPLHIHKPAPTNSSRPAGAGKPGFTIPDETFAIKHDAPGLVGLATSGEPHTASAQFYITLGPLPWLDGKRGEVGSDMTSLMGWVEGCGMSPLAAVPGA